MLLSPSPSSTTSLSPLIFRPPPSAVTYDLTQPHQTTITLPPGSTWTSGLHWHATHTEYLLLVRGRIKLRLGNKIRILHAPKNGEKLEVEVSRGERHEWGRADGGMKTRKGDDGEEEEEEEENDVVVVIERTSPADGEKSLFFWNLNGVILSAQTAQPETWWQSVLVNWWTTLSLFVIFRDLDNLPVFWDLGGSAEAVGGWVPLLALAHAVEALVTISVLGVAGLMGACCGVRAIRRERTPNALWEDWESRHSKGEKKRS